MKKVLYARLQTRFYTPKAGDLGDVFPPTTKTLDGLNMECDTSYLYVSFRYRGVQQLVAIPTTNIVGMELAVEAPKPVSTLTAA